MIQFCFCVVCVFLLFNLDIFCLVIALKEQLSRFLFLVGFQHKVHRPTKTKVKYHALGCTVLHVIVNRQNRLGFVLHDPFRQVGETIGIVSRVRQFVQAAQNYFKKKRPSFQLSFEYERADRPDNSKCWEYVFHWLLSFQRPFVINKYFRYLIEPDFVKLRNIALV